MVEFLNEDVISQEQLLAFLLKNNNKQLKKVIEENIKLPTNTLSDLLFNAIISDADFDYTCFNYLLKYDLTTEQKMEILRMGRGVLEFFEEMGEYLFDDLKEIVVKHPLVCNRLPLNLTKSEYYELFVEGIKRNASIIRFLRIYSVFNEQDIENLVLHAIAYGLKDYDIIIDIYGGKVGGGEERVPIEVDVAYFYKNIYECSVDLYRKIFRIIEDKLSPNISVRVFKEHPFLLLKFFAPTKEMIMTALESKDLFSVDIFPFFEITEEEVPRMREILKVHPKIIYKISNVSEIHEDLIRDVMDDLPHALFLLETPTDLDIRKALLKNSRLILQIRKKIRKTLPDLLLAVKMNIRLLKEMSDLTEEEQNIVYSELGIDFAKYYRPICESVLEKIRSEIKELIW